MPDDPTIPIPDPVSAGDVAGGEVPDDGEPKMADVPDKVHEQALSRLSAAGAQAHEHFVQFGKVLDYSYEQDRKMVSLVEALGVREVTSQSGQKGIPGSAGP